MNRPCQPSDPSPRGVPASRLAGLLVASAALLASVPAAAGSFSIPASDAGFVTEAGGSAKGDGTVVAPAKYNYSVGFELHYGTGALGAPLAPMFRKNYFVFDLSAITEPIASAKLVLWTGTLESTDASEAFVLKASIDMPGVLGLAAALAGATSTSAFDSPSDPLVMDAATLYGKLADGPLALGGLVVTHAMDDSFIDIALSPGALGYLSGFAGGKVALAGVVPTAVPPAFAQQPFGFTGPDIAGGDPKTPMLVITTVPEPAAGWLMLAGVGLLAALRRRS